MPKEGEVYRSHGMQSAKEGLFGGLTRLTEDPGKRNRRPLTQKEPTSQENPSYIKANYPSCGATRRSGNPNPWPPPESAASCFQTLSECLKKTQETRRKAATRFYGRPSPQLKTRRGELHGKRDAVIRI